MQTNYTYLVRSLDLAGLLQSTLHRSYADAATEQKFRRDECGHREVIVMPVETEVIELPTRGQVVAYREPEPTHRAGTRKAQGVRA